MSLPSLVAIAGDSVLIRAKKGQLQAKVKGSTLVYENGSWVTRYIVSILNHDLEVHADQIIPVLDIQNGLDLDMIMELHLLNRPCKLHTLSFSELNKAQKIVTSHLNTIIFSNRAEFDFWLPILKAIKTIQKERIPEASEEVKALKPFIDLKWQINYGSR